MRYDGVKGRFRQVPASDILELGTCTLWARCLVIYLCKHADGHGRVPIARGKSLGESLAVRFSAHHKEHLALERWAQEALQAGALTVEGDALAIKDFAHWQARRQVELWRRLYSREEGPFASLSVAARLLSTEFVRKSDHRGDFYATFDSAESLARVLKARCTTDADKRLLPAAVRALADEGFLVIGRDRATVRNFGKAQREETQATTEGLVTPGDDYPRRVDDVSTTYPRRVDDVTTTYPQPNHDVSTTYPRRMDDVTHDASARNDMGSPSSMPSPSTQLDSTKLNSMPPSCEGGSGAQGAPSHARDDIPSPSAPPTVGESAPEPQQGLFGFVKAPEPKDTPKRARKAPSRGGKRALTDLPPPTEGAALAILHAVQATRAFRLICPNPNSFAVAFAERWSHRGLNVAERVAEMEVWLLNPKNQAKSNGWAFAENWCAKAWRDRQGAALIDGARSSAARATFGEPIVETRVVDVFGNRRKQT